MEYQFAHGLVKSKVVEDLRKIEEGEIGKEDLYLLKGVYKTDIRIFCVLCAVILLGPTFIATCWIVFEQFGNAALYYSGIAILVAILITWVIISNFVDKIIHERTRSYYRFIIRRIRQREKRNRE